VPIRPIEPVSSCCCAARPLTNFRVISGVSRVFAAVPSSATFDGFLSSGTRLRKGTAPILQKAFSKRVVEYGIPVEWRNLRERCVPLCEMSRLPRAPEQSAGYSRCEHHNGHRPTIFRCEAAPVALTPAGPLSLFHLHR